MSARLEGIAHDMRAPLGAIQAYAALLSAHAEEPQAIRRYAAQLETACDQLMELAEGLLDGEVRAASAERCTAVSLAQEAASLYPGRVELALEGAFDGPLMARRVHVRRILVNLLSNAVKYAPAGTPIRLSVTARRQGARCAVRYAVQDEGPGMSGATMARLFEPYARGEETAHIPGRGLGLCVARELARAMGGELSARSAPGAGSMFVLNVTLPVAAQASLAGRRFLVAEDNALARDALCELLCDSGAQAECAGDGGEAVRLFARRPQGWFDAVLMDALMPVMDGFAAAATIRAMDREDAQRVPIFALTGADTQQAARRAQESGMRHVVKPITMDALALLLQAEDGDEAGDERSLVR